MLVIKSCVDTPNGVMVTVEPTIGSDETKTKVFEGVEKRQMVYGEDQYYNQDKMVQDAFSFLNNDQREFIMTGIDPEEWEELFKYEEG